MRLPLSQNWPEYCVCKIFESRCRCIINFLEN
jgi:hypothetical protein